jgi:subtilisin family serine protease
MTQEQAAFGRPVSFGVVARLVTPGRVTARHGTAPHPTALHGTAAQRGTANALASVVETASLRRMTTTRRTGSKQAGQRVLNTAAKKPTAPPKRTTATAGDATALKQLQRLADDQNLSDADWNKVEKAITKAKDGAPVVAHLLTLFVDGYVKDTRAKEKVVRLLNNKLGLELTIDQTKLNADIIKGTTTAEYDATFDKLSQVVGDTESMVTISVVDGGFAQHPSLTDNIVVNRLPARARYGAGFWKNFGQLTEAQRREGAVHGTHVLGIATAGTARIQATANAVPLDTAEQQQAAADAAAATGEAVPERTAADAKKDHLFQAIEAAAKGGARIVNISIETGVSTAAAEAYQEMMRRYPATLFVLGAGNGQYELGSIAEGELLLAEAFKLDNMAVVGASLPGGGRWTDTNTSAKFVDLAARGHYIASADSDGAGYRIDSGTSMAAPNVTNAAAKCLLLDSTLTPKQLKKLLAVTSDIEDNWRGMVASNGTINADRAMLLAAFKRLLAKNVSPADAFAKLGVAPAEQHALSAALQALLA